LDFTQIGRGRRMVELERALLEPNAQILFQNRLVRLVTRDGVTITGRLLNQDTFSVQLIDSKERLHSLQKSSLNEYAFIDKSPMPTYRDKMNPPELADLDRKSTRLNSSHGSISYAVFCSKKNKL